MKKNGTIRVRNLSFIFLEDEFIYITDKDEHDYHYLNVIYENMCPDCPPEEKEDYPIGMCKVVEIKKMTKSQIKEMLNENSDMLSTILIDMKLKFGNVSDDEEFFVYKLKNQLI